MMVSIIVVISKEKWWTLRFLRNILWGLSGLAFEVVVDGNTYKLLFLYHLSLSIFQSP